MHAGSAAGDGLGVHESRDLVGAAALHEGLEQGRKTIGDRRMPAAQKPAEIPAPPVEEVEDGGVVLMPGPCREPSSGEPGQALEVALGKVGDVGPPEQAVQKAAVEVGGMPADVQVQHRVHEFLGLLQVEATRLAGDRGDNRADQQAVEEFQGLLEVLGRRRGLLGGFRDLLSRSLGAFDGVEKGAVHLRLLQGEGSSQDRQEGNKLVAFQLLQGAAGSLEGNRTEFVLALEKAILVWEAQGIEQGEQESASWTEEERPQEVIAEGGRRPGDGTEMARELLPFHALEALQPESPLAVDADPQPGRRVLLLLVADEGQGGFLPLLTGEAEP